VLKVEVGAVAAVFITFIFGLCKYTEFW